MFDFIIYDFDGTISDTYPIFAKALVETAASYNIQTDYSTAYKQLKISVGYALNQYNWNDDMENDFGKNGEYIGLDVKVMRTEKQEGSYKHLENSLKIAKMLEEKAAKFDCDFQKKCVEERDYEALEMYVMELLIKG